MRKILIYVLTVFMLLGISGCNSTTTNMPSDNNEVVKEGKYPTKWNDEEFYKTQADLDTDFEKINEWAEEYEKYKGKLNTVEGLLGYIKADLNEEYNAAFDRLNSYTNFGTSAFPTEKKYADALDRLYEEYGQLCERREFITEEMAAIPYEKRIELLSDERLAEYLPFLYEYCFEDVAVVDEGVQQIYNDATLSQGKIRTVFDQFSNFEIPEVEYKLLDGEGSVIMSNRNTRTVLQEDQYSLRDKYGMNELWWENASRFKNILTSLLEIDMLEQYSRAKINGYTSTKYEALYNVGFEEDIIQKIIDYGHAYSDKLQEYYKLLANEDGSYYFFSNYNMISPYKAEYVPYDDGVDTVIAALSVMGDEYTKILTEEFNSGHIDVYPADNKKPGAFECGNYLGLYPFIEFNYNGTYTDVATLAHETGHACYDILCNRNQGLYDWGAAVFTHEVASLTNELTYYQYMIDNSKTDEEKLYHVQKMLACLVLNIYDGCYWQEFEDHCHQLVESGQPLVAEELAEYWQDLGKQYYGEGLDQGEYGMYKWSTLANIHNNYYEYSYATAMCYATVLSQNLVNGVPGAKENYLEFLKTGAATPSVDALKIAGIDIYDDAVYDKAFGFFESAVNQFAELTKKVKK